MADELVVRGDDASASTALVAADAAAETVLGVLGAWSALPLKPEPRYHDVTERALDASAKAGFPISQALLADLRSSHATRNTVVHHGAVATAQHARLASSCVRRLLSLLGEVAPAFGALPAGSGVVTAIASLLDAPELTESLMVGEAALRAADASATADAATRAHSALLFRLDPPIGRDQPGRLASWDSKDLGRAQRYVEDLGKSVTDLAGWVTASALGLTPVVYRRLRHVMGVHIQYAGGNDDIRRTDVPTLEDAGWALTTVAEMAYRLSQLGGLLEGTRDEVVRRRYGLGG